MIVAQHVLGRICVGTDDGEGIDLKIGAMRNVLLMARYIEPLLHLKEERFRRF